MLGDAAEVPSSVVGAALAIYTASDGQKVRVRTPDSSHVYPASALYGQWTRVDEEEGP